MGFEDLFSLGPLLQYLEPVDVPTAERTTCSVSGISGLIGQLEEYKKEHGAASIGAKSKKAAAHSGRRKTSSGGELDRELVNWDPEKDPQVSGDPYRTIFVGRLDYSVDELELGSKFSQFGETEQVRVVRDRSGKSRGYGFVVYRNERETQVAFHRGNGMPINGRQVVVDIERGRVVKNWKPRRLGGGLGGRHYTRPRVSERFERGARSGGGFRGNSRRGAGTGYRGGATGYRGGSSSFRGSRGSRGSFDTSSQNYHR